MKEKQHSPQQIKYTNVRVKIVPPKDTEMTRRQVADTNTKQKHQKKIFVCVNYLH